MARFVCHDGHAEFGATVYPIDGELVLFCFRCGNELGRTEQPDGDIGIRSGPGNGQDRLLLEDATKSEHPSGSGKRDSGGTGGVGSLAPHLASVPGEVAQ